MVSWGVAGGVAYLFLPPPSPRQAFLPSLTLRKHLRPCPPSPSLHAHTDTLHATLNTRTHIHGAHARNVRSCTNPITNTQTRMHTYGASLPTTPLATITLPVPHPFPEAIPRCGFTFIHPFFAPPIVDGATVPFLNNLASSSADAVPMRRDFYANQRVKPQSPLKVTRPCAGCWPPSGIPM